MTGSEGLRAELDRDLGLVGATALGVGTMVAAGIFVLSGVAVGAVGAMAIVAFLLAAAAASLTALSYAEFAGLHPESGGGYAYVANVFETDLSYVVGWAMILGYPASAAFYLAAFADWSSTFLLPALSFHAAIPSWTLGAGALVVLLGFNLFGTRESGLLQLATAVLKLGVIGLFSYGALGAFDPEVLATSVRQNASSVADLHGLALTSGLVFVTFFGFEAIATNAEEIKRPGTTVPRAIFISLGTVVVASVLAVAAMVVAVERPGFLSFLAQQTGVATPAGTDALTGETGTVAMGYVAQYYFGETGLLVLVGGALLSMITAANATVLAGSRVKLAMARRGHLPDWFGRLHPRTNTPYGAVLLTGALVLGFLLLFSVRFGPLPVVGGASPLGLSLLAQFAGFMLLVGLSAVNVALIGSRVKQPDATRAFRVPLVPLLPALAVLANLLLLVGLERDATLLGIGTLATATVVGWVALDHDRPPETLAAHWSERSPGSDDDVSVLTPVRGAQDRPLVTVGGALAAGVDGTVMPLGVVELPAQTPTSAGWRYLDQRNEMLQRAAAGVDDEFVEPRVRSGHEFGRAVRNAVDDHDPEVLLLSPRDAVDVCLFGGGRSVFASLEETFDCDVAIYRPGPLRDADSVFVGAADGPHADTAVAAAASIARATDARLDLYRAVDGDASEATMSEAHDDLEARGDGLADVETRTLVEPTETVAESFLDRSEESDLVVIGSSDGRNGDVDVAGALLRTREKPTLVVQSGGGSVHLPLF